MMDLVGIIEAAYRPALDERTWVEGLVAATRPALDDGLGLVAYAYEYDPAAVPALSLRRLVEAGVHPGADAALAHVIARASPKLLSRALRSAAFVTMSQLTRNLPRDRDLIAATTEALGFSDLIGVSAGDPTGAGLVLAAPRRHIASVPRGAVVAWSRIAAHLAAGLRLQRLAARTGAATGFTGAEAILDAGGRVQHAEPAAQPPAHREALREAALNLRRAAGRLRQRDPAEAVAAWRALVAGRWSLVDYFDRDGRRFLVARRNDPDARPVADLSLRERQVVGYACLGHSNKLIAYELGLSPSSIATYLARAATKLGAESRAALIRVCTTLAAEGREPPAVTAEAA